MSQARCQCAYHRLLTNKLRIDVWESPSDQTRHGQVVMRYSLREAAKAMRQGDWYSANLHAQNAVLASSLLVREASRKRMAG